MNRNICQTLGATVKDQCFATSYLSRSQWYKCCAGYLRIIFPERLHLGEEQKRQYIIYYRRRTDELTDRGCQLPNFPEHLRAES